MIARVFRGWTSAANGPKYDEFLSSSFLPSLHQHDGYAGAQVLHRADGEEVEFLITSYWRSLDAIRAAVGEDVEAAYIAPDAREMLSHWEPRCQHFEIAFEDRAMVA